MTPLYWVLSAVAVQRLLELALAARNTRRLKAEGAVEIGQRHYPLFVVLHTAWLASIAATVAPQTIPHLPALVILAILMAARIWVMASLGRYWTTRIITLPSAPLVRRGPYRFVRHPNYLVVAGEVAVLPLAFDAVLVAIIFSALNGALLMHRIAVEDRALATRRISARGSSVASG